MSSISNNSSSSEADIIANHDINDVVPHPSVVDVVSSPTNAMPSLPSISRVKIFIEDQRNLAPEHVSQYIWMLGRGVHDEIPEDFDISSSVGTLKKALDLGVLKKKKIVISKKILLQELMRRQEGKKLNANNKKAEELFRMLHDGPSLDDADMVFIKDKISEYLDQIRKGIEEIESKRKESGGRIEMTDRLRYVCAIDYCGDIREAYMKSQDTLSRQALDARNSSAAAPDYHDLIVNKFNDSSWVPKTLKNPDLHSFFSEEIECVKREFYSMSREKSKMLLLDMKHKLNDICKRYERSGNGAGQLDSDVEDNEMENALSFGRFNSVIARLKGGDDRQSFLLHEPVDLLYWWDVLDRHNLIHFTTAQLRGDIGVTAESSPFTTSYGSRDSDDMNSNAGSNRKRSKTASKDNEDIISSAVSQVSMSIRKMSEQNIMVHIDQMRKEKWRIEGEWRRERKNRDEYDSDTDGQYYKRRIEEIDKSIQDKELYLDKLYFS